MKSQISHRRDGPLTYVVIDDGGKNVLTLEIVKQLHEIVGNAADDPGTKSLILQGNEDALSVGLDTKTVLSGSDSAKTLLQKMGDILNTLYLSSLRSVVVVQGHATAAGAMLLLAADYRIAFGKQGKIGLSEVSVGLSVPEATQQLIRDRINVQYQYMTTALAELVDHHQAKDMGFIDEVSGSRDEALAAATAIAESLAGFDDSAYMKTKLGMRRRYRELSDVQT